jgi:hypothetical protein
VNIGSQHRTPSLLPFSYLCSLDLTGLNMVTSLLVKDFTDALYSFVSKYYLYSNTVLNFLL